MRNVFLLDLINGISQALDVVSSAVTGHHRRVGIASAAIAAPLGLSKEDSTDLLMAGLLHDIGAFSMDFKLDGLDFDADLVEHTEVGYHLLRGHPLLSRAAYMVKNHHTPWQEAKQAANGMDEETLFLGNVLSLVDRVDLLNSVGPIQLGRERIRDVIASYSRVVYSGKAIDAFMDISASSEFWERIADTESPVRELVGNQFDDKLIPEDQLLLFSSFFSRIIDFRSRHTATHSQGVAETAVQLAKLAGMNDAEQKRMRLAGNLHDIGKLAVPARLLDKPASLDSIEYAEIQSHAAVCEKVLRSIPGLEDIAEWACQHHERINGTGYPHGLSGDEISQGSRILAVADVHTAICEDRPYRDGMAPNKAMNVLRSMADKQFLDPDIVGLAIDNFDQIDAVRRISQTQALMDFKFYRSN